MFGAEHGGFGGGFGGESTGSVGQEVWAPERWEEIPEILAACRAKGKHVVLRGQGTKDAYGGPCSGEWSLLSTLGLRRVLRYRPEDLTVTVEAGVRLGDLEEVLAERGQTLGWDVPGGAAATVGGAVAAGIDGPRHARHGRLRDDVLEVRALLADGTPVRSGAPVVKNVAGYDLNRLFVGSWGALGCITALTLKVRPLPRDQKTHVRRLSDRDEAEAWCRAVREIPQAAGAVLLAGEELLGVVHLEGRSAGLARALALLGLGDVLEGTSGLPLLSRSLAPGGPVPTLFLAVDPAEVVAELFTLRESLSGAHLAGDVQNGWVRVAADVSALDDLAQGGRPYRFEGARWVLGSRRLYGPPRREEELWWEVLQAFDPEPLWCRERLWPERLSARRGAPETEKRQARPEERKGQEEPTP